VDVASYALGYIVVGITLAVAGAGVYSLVAAWLVQSCMKLVGSFILRPHSLRLLFWYDRASTMLSVGSTVFVTNLANWFLNGLDRLLIGRLLNAKAVGLYNVAYNLANTPNSLLLTALQPAFFSAGARMQDDPQRLGRAYLQMVATIWVLVAPLFIFFSLISSDLVRVLYGARWTDAGGVLALLFLVMPMYATWGLSTPVLWNTGRKHYETLLQLPLLLIAVLAFYRFAPIGIHAAALVAVGLLASRGLVMGVAAFRAVGLRLSDLFPHLLRGVLLSSLAAGGARLGQYATSRLGAPLVSLVSASLVALVLVLAVVCAKPGILGGHAAAMVVRFVPKLRGFLRVPDSRLADSNASGGNG
jgi:O-antigen/teichoic acid export membrane protein